MPKVKKQGKRGVRQHPYARASTATPVQAPQAKSVITRNRGPSYTPLPDGGIRVKHREMIGYSAMMNVGFSIDADCPLFINPSIPGTFPWLSSIADSYEKWRPVEVRMVYVPMVSTNTAGNIIMACDYDATDQLPTTSVGLEQNKTAVSGPVWSTLSLELSARDMLENVKAYYTGPALTPGDRRQAYAGQLIIGYDGITTVQQIGKFYMEYVIDLLIPQQAPVASMAIDFNLETETLNDSLYRAWAGSKDAQRLMYEPPFYDAFTKTLNLRVQGDGGYNFTWTQENATSPADLFDLSSWDITDVAGQSLTSNLGAKAIRLGTAKSTDAVSYSMYFRSPVEKAILKLVGATAATFASSFVAFVISRCTSRRYTGPYGP